MNALLILARVVHIGAALFMFGGLVLALGVSGPAVARGGGQANALGERVERFVRTVAWSCLAAGLGSAVVWLMLEAALMSGAPLPEALRGGALMEVLRSTTFGRAWTIRMAVAAAFAVLLLVARRTRHPAAAWLALAFAAGYLASLAFFGHAVVGQGGERIARIAADATHLLAAGAWLGALPGLVYLLAAVRGAPVPATIDVAGRALRRFSTLGMLSVLAVLVTGIVNAWYLAGGVPGLLGTAYGRLLLAKVGLFVAMLALAARNRWHFTPRACGGDLLALRALARNARLEVLAGVAIVAIVGVLGITIPGAHQAPVWPLAFTLTLQSVDAAARNLWIGGWAAAAACIVAALALAGGPPRERRGRVAAIVAAALVVAAALTCPWWSVAPAYPTTYAVSPEPYAVAAIGRGARLFSANCAECHGASGHGDGPMASSVPVKPADLVLHGLQHREGDLYWWIAHGIPDSPMPAFTARMDERQMWDLVQYVRALAAASAAQDLAAQVSAGGALAAPDFAFDDATGSQQTLAGQGRVVLLVSYTLPTSLPRLRDLAMESRALARAGVRVIAIPAGAPVSSAALQALATGEGDAAGSMLAVTGDDVAATYAMFACAPESACGAGTPPHVEWLVDRWGYLRARWIGVPEDGAAQTREIAAGAAQLGGETAPPAAKTHHAH